MLIIQGGLVDDKPTKRNFYENERTPGIKVFH